MWANLRRLVAAMVMIIGLVLLAIVIEGVFMPTYETVFDASSNPDSAWFGPVEWLPNTAYLIIAILIVGIMFWVIIGPIRETRLEHERRRIR